jgi:membrane protease YdiL (CAAX protease family)
VTSHPFVTALWALLPVAIAFGLSFLPERYKVETALSREQTWGCRDVSLAFAVVFGVNLLLRTVEPLRRVAGQSLWTLEMAALFPLLLYMAPVGFIVLRRERKSLQSLGLGREGVVPVIASATSVYFFVVFLWSAWRYFGGKGWSSLYTNRLFGDLLHLTPIGHSLLIVTLVVAGGLADEIIFRGFALIPLSRVIGPVGAIVATALSWSMVHFTIAGRTLAFFIEGLLYGCVFYRAGSLLPTLTFHGLSNLGAVSDFVFGRLAKAGLRWTSREHFLYIGLGSLSVSLAAVLIALLGRPQWRSQTQQRPC